MRHIRHAIISLRSKRSRTTRTKIQPECEKTPSRGPNFVRVVRERLLRYHGHTVEHAMAQK